MMGLVLFSRLLAWCVPSFFLHPPYLTQAARPSAQEEADTAADFLLEPAWKRKMVNVNAVVLMAVAMFFWGFYA